LAAERKEIEGVRGGKEGEEDEGQAEEKEGQGGGTSAGAEGPHELRTDDDDDDAGSERNWWARTGRRGQAACPVCICVVVRRMDEEGEPSRLLDEKYTRGCALST